MNRTHSPRFTPMASPSEARAPTVPASEQPQVIATLWRGRLTIIICICIASLVSGIYAFAIATPKYASTAQLAIQARNQQVVDLESVISGVSTEDEAINTELRVLKSRALVGQLVAEMNLLEDLEFNPFLAEPSAISVSEIMRLAIARLGFGLAESDPPSPAHILNKTIKQVTKAISVASIRDTYLFDITVKTKDPEKSADMANRLAEIYLRDQIKTKFAATEFAVDWLTGRVTELETELKQKEDAIKALRAETELVSLDALEALNLRAKDLRERLSEAQLVAAVALEKSDGSNRHVIQRDALQASYQKIMRDIEVQNTDLVELNRLTREADATRVLHQTFLTRLKETSVQIGLQRADARVLSDAITGEIVQPRKKIILALSIVLGMMLGAAIVLFRQFQHDGFRNSQDLEQATGHTVLGQIPKIPISARKDLLRYLNEKPTSPAAEAVRNLRTSVLLTQLSNPPQVILAASSVPGEGKTTQSISLAHNLARMGKRVLLVEGDIRRRTFDQYFDQSPPGNLITVINDELPLQGAILRDDNLEADVLMAADTNENAADLFSSQGFAEFILAAREEYDFVIVDTPPVLVVPDARVIGCLADAILYVVNWDKTSQTQVFEGMQQFSSVGLKISGLVLSQIDPKRMQRYGYGDRYGAYASYSNNYYEA